MSDFPETSSHLLDTLANHRDGLAPPGEPLGVTDYVTHHIDLQLDTCTTYVPSFHLPYSRCAAAQNLVQDMLNQSVSEESHQPWNSSLLLVPKKDGSNG